MGKYKLAGFIALIMVLLCFWGWQKQKITVSVVIPVYNAEKYLSDCLDSIVKQNGDFEIIIVNDGSTDNSAKIIKEYAGKYKNIKVISQTNQGVSAARNAGIKIAQNRYITFVDSDDWLEPDAFSQAFQILSRDKPDVLLTGFYDVYDKEWVRQTRGEQAAGEVKGIAKFPTRKLDKLALFSPFRAQDAYSDLFYVGTGVRGQFFKNSFVKNNNLSFPIKAKCVEDDVFVYRAFMHNPLISVLPAPIYDYRNRIDSISKAKSVITDSRKTLEILQQTAEYKKAPRRVQMYMMDSWLAQTILGINNLIRHGEPLHEGIAIAQKAYNTFSIYNKQEQSVCRNLKILQNLLRNYAHHQ